MGGFLPPLLFENIWLADHTEVKRDSDVPVEKKGAPFYLTDIFIFALKFTHIHIFEITVRYRRNTQSAIVILMGMLVLFLDVSQRIRI